jgi:hypothetical protein
MKFLRLSRWLMFALVISCFVSQVADISSASNASWQAAIFPCGSWAILSTLKSDRSIQPFDNVLSVASLDSMHAAVALHKPRAKTSL